MVKAILAQSLQTAEPNVTNNSTLAPPLQEYNGYLQGLLVLAIVVAFLLVLKSVLQGCPCVTIMNDDCLKDAVYMLYREVVIVACGALLVQTLDYYSLIALDRDKAIQASYCLVTASVVWTLVGTAFVLNARSQIATWRAYEDLAGDYKEL